MTSLIPSRSDWHGTALILVLAVLAVSVGGAASADSGSDPKPAVGHLDEQHAHTGQAADITEPSSATEGVCHPETMLTASDVTRDGIHSNAVVCMAAHHIMNGRGDGTFRPSESLTRGQMASLIANFVRAAEGEREIATAAAPFEDIQSSVHASSVQTISALGLTSGVTHSEYEPQGTVSRGQMASFLFRIHQLLGVEFGDVEPSKFQDVGAGSAHGEAIETLAGAGIISGLTTETYAPQEPLTREQTASLLHRSAETLKSEGRWVSPVPATGTAPGDASDPGADHVATGHQAGGFTVPAGATWQIEGEVTTDQNVVVHGTLAMRSGSSLTFLDVDEDAFVGGGMDVIDSDVGLWVMGDGQLDIQGTEKQGWNRTGTHPTWTADDEYVRAPSGGENRAAQPWSLGDAVPCETFAGEEYCAEVANLTRDVTIQGTPDGGSHIFIRSDQPQTIRYATLSHMGPNGDSDDPDGRYGIHFHHAHDGSRGSLVEGVVVRDSGDHAFAPHESHGITFRDTIAYNVRNTPYWWDPGDHSNDITYERALALEVSGDRDAGQNLSGFRMAQGERNACVECVAAAVSAGRPSSGFGWVEGTPNKWEFVDSVAHHNHQGVYHWRNEPFVRGAAHEHHGFVAYRNGGHGIEQGAYVIQAHWYDVTLFANGKDALINRGSPRNDLNPGIVYAGGTLGGSPPVSFRKMAQCPAEGNHILVENLDLIPDGSTAVLIDKDSCPDGGSPSTFHVVFRNVTVDGRLMTESDFNVVTMPSDGVITVERSDGSTFTIGG